jgi:hypothetical protein
VRGRGRVWQRVAAAASVDGEVGPGRLRGGRLLLLAVVDRLVVPEAVQAGVNPPAYVTHGLPGRSHVNVLNMPFEPRQGGQALVTGLASVIFLGGAGATWSQHKQLTPSKLPNALLMHSPYRSLSFNLSTATPLYI